MASRSLFGMDQSTSKPPIFSPPATNKSSNGLFSAQSTPQGDRFLDASSLINNGNNSLFAGATPAAKSASTRFGRGGLFSANSGKPAFNLDAPSGKLLFDASAERYSSPPEDNHYGGDGYPPQIYEDDSRGEPTAQDEEEDTGMYGDDESFAEEDFNMRDDTDLSPRGRGRSVIGKIGDPVEEPGSLILRTEGLMEELANLILPPSAEDGHDMDLDLERPLPPSIEEQQEIFAKYSKLFLAAFQEHLPKTQKTQFEKNMHNAYHLASLALPLHHSTANTTETLRKWVFTHHPDPSRQQLTAVRATHPNSAFSPDFWDVVSRLVLRGEVQEAVEVLHSANWDLLSTDAPAVSKPAFGPQKINDKRYSPAEIESIKEAVHNTIKLLTMCPGKGRSSYQPPFTLFPPINPNVDSPGTPADWRIWRGQVLRVAEELKGFSQSDDTYDDEIVDSFVQPNRPGSFGFNSRRSTKVKVPNDILRPLRNIYEIMRGNEDAIFTSVEIWQEAAAALMMWAKNVDSPEAEEEEEFEESVSTSNMSHGEYLAILTHRKRRQLSFLRSVIERIAEQTPMDPNANLELALAGTMAADNDFLTYLEEYSPLCASAVVEIGGWSGWIKRELPIPRPSNCPSFLDVDDLTVLEMSGDGGAKREAQTAENILRRYGCDLLGTPWIDEPASVEGWEVAVGVLTRVKSGQALAEKLLTALPLVSTPRTSKLLTHCTSAHPTAAAEIAYTWSQHLLTLTPKPHGEILYFLSLSHRRPALHSLIHDLIITTLTTRNPHPSVPDPQLSQLLQSPESCSSDLLRFEISGYAALRSYFEHRHSSPEKAVKTLVAAIRCAGEPIDGGSWDKGWETPVDPTVLYLLLSELEKTMGLLKVCDAVEVSRVVTDFEACGEGVRKAQVGGDAGVLRKVRLGIAGILAKGWLRG